MNILILGATGFIGSAIANRMLSDGHAVTGLGRNPGRARLKQPGMRWIGADLSRMTSAADWIEIILGQDVVINCAGALQDGLSDDLAATQANSMLALYEAAGRSSQQRIVQISARTAGAAGNLPFLATKRKADEALAASGLPHVILRPALVLGRNAYGGSALLRALASFPFCLPLVHAGSAAQAVALDDVVTAVSDAACGRLTSGTDLDLAAGETMTLGDLVLLHRQWLGLPPAPVIALHESAAKPVAWLADFAGRLGWRSPLRSTAMTVMSEGVHTRTTNGGTRATRPLSAALLSTPSGIQDLWFARLYLLKPLMIGCLSLFWLLSGVIPLFGLERASDRFLPIMPPGAAVALTLLTCFIDMLLGAAVLVRPLSRFALTGMLAVSLAYLAGACILEPSLWLDPLGPLVKVLPSLLLTLACLAILDER
ncbi:oxidoreductase [Rhizobium sp. Root1203]|uniref:SDR family oxidoreductase n=1 Tax=Rhizobium sp. Root1203 TaxID=1736427 RepID=UPI0007111088|nr:SDR family oxidoreductase [Rhizobium sp. Root1203]KQV28271.1 oxidoreductase [Rhizobium sp. Root1203]